ncbi:hypothetical protein COU15_00700 [Candidatus Kaiserbacteria bacterium CG10_big_fil_rev_8_21_14_0_10_45_20]|uniref:Uncharacterized protein n=1 Tax=Candidatus Kaiserbacteria bacterium CG10_big_fil_rev_8_21_14_0_10_45_20 TaxID=1974607 RepID=A0A2H0UGD1_9BACT|nr:MAG: hypothetical protein COU15_00700 [Candidatus Kaiserbacteria bacterium CG10_big_fil_rev_8_21_14_0_10_45_20]
MNPFKNAEKAVLPLAILTSITACQERHSLSDACESARDGETFILELHTAINETEERHQNQRGERRHNMILSDLLRDTQTCPVNALEEARSVFNFAYQKTRDPHFARQMGIVQSLINIRRAENEEESRLAIEDTI